MTSFARVRSLLLTVPILLLWSSSAGATVLRAVDLEEKIDRAGGIILGKCVRQVSRWDHARNWILTYSTFEIEKTLKGAPAREVTVVTPGGTVGNVAQETIGVPRFQSGEERVLFLRDSAAGPTVLYLEQGAYRVDRDGRGNRLVRPALSSQVLVDTGRGRSVAPEPERPLEEFERTVRETIRRRELLRMELLEREAQEKASIRSVLRRNAGLVALALAGAILATWQVLKRW